MEGETPLILYDRMYELIKECVKEFTESLCIISALRFGTASESEDGFTLLNLESIRDCYLNGRSMRVKGYPPLDRYNLKEKYASWLNNLSYDSFDEISFDLIEKEYRASLYDCYVPYAIQKDWSWFVDSFCVEKINQKYFQRYAILYNKCLSDETFASESDAIKYWSKNDRYGIVVYVGPRHHGSDLLFLAIRNETNILKVLPFLDLKLFLLVTPFSSIHRLQISGSLLNRGTVR